MIKHILTLMRGRLFEADADFAARNALPLLAQQIRDSAASIQTTRHAVAIAIAEIRQEEAQLDHLRATVADLEARAVAALEKGDESLAREAAEVIARLEDECAVSDQARQQVAVEIGRLRRLLRQSEARLRELKRGERLARAAESARDLGVSAGGEASPLKDAEETLDTLRKRQERTRFAAAALSELDGDPNPSEIVEKLAAAGHGTALHTSADDVLVRLKRRMNQTT
jgi:phage shock protein A